MDRVVLVLAEVGAGLVAETIARGGHWLDSVGAAPEPGDDRAAAVSGGSPMKITINVDCSPEEARAFMGLPDVAPLQEAAMAHMKANLDKAAATMNPETIMKTLFPIGPEKMAEMQ